MASGFRSVGYGNDVTRGLTALVNRVHDARQAALPALALLLVRQIKITLSQPGRGRVYLRNAAVREAGGRLRSATTGRFVNHRARLFLDHAGRVRNYRGRFLTKHGAGRHVASRPGDPPAVDTNALRGSISWEWDGPNVRVGSDMEKAAWLEYGTVGPEFAGGRIKPRPFMRPSVERVRPLVAAVLRSHYEIIGRLGRSGAA
jgi:phage gpG-like protein